MIIIVKIIPAIIILQTLFYKFTGHPESKELFTKVKLLGLPEKYGRIGTGILELIFGILVLVPQTTIVGAIGIIMLMSGALASHISKIGFRGKNLWLAISGGIALLCSILIITIY